MLNSVELNQIPLWLHFPLNCGLPLSSSSCLCHQPTWGTHPLGAPLNSCWPWMCLPSTSVNWEELMGDKSWIWDSPKVFVCTNPGNSWNSCKERSCLVGEEECVSLPILPHVEEYKVQGCRSPVLKALLTLCFLRNLWWKTTSSLIASSLCNSLYG